MVQLPPGLLKCLKVNLSKNKLIIIALEPASSSLRSAEQGLPHSLPCPQFSWQQNPDALASRPRRRPRRPPPSLPTLPCAGPAPHTPTETHTQPKAEGTEEE